MTKHYLFVSDFDQTLSFNDSGRLLSEMLGITGFDEKVAGLSRLNLVQSGAELAYLLRHDPEYRRVRRSDLAETGRNIRLKRSIHRLPSLLATGIEGYSFLNVAILCGLIDGGVEHAVDIVDWTTGKKFLYLYHLRGWTRNNRVAKELATRISDYQNQYPGRPVWLVGHSGGGGMALLTAAALPDERQVTGIVLLAAAVSPTFDIRPAAARVTRGIWNYHSQLDWFFLVFGTTLLGTMDGQHVRAAGACGFRGLTTDELMNSGSLIQRPWQWKMLSQFHLGEHFGCAHRVFVAEEIVPLIRAGEEDQSGR